MSFPRYEKYKESGVEWLGEVPEHWALRRMKTLFEIKKRIAGVTGYDILSITQNGIKIKDTDSNEGQLAMDYAKYQLVYPGDFAMNHMDLLTGYIDISKVEGVTSPDYRVFSVRNPILTHANFFLRLFQTAYNQKIFYAFGQGASQFGRWRLPTEAFNEFSLPYPPISEQLLITDFLGREIAKLDALIDEQRRLIELLKEKRQRAISYAVTKGINCEEKLVDSGYVELGKVPNHWKITPLGYFSRLHRGHDLTSEQQEEGPYPVVTSGGITGFHSTYIAKAPGVVTGRYGSTGRLFYIETNYWPHNTSLYVSDFFGNDSRFVWYSLQAINFESHSAKSAVPGIDRNDLHVLPVAVPPRAEQAAIVKHLDSLMQEFDNLSAEALRATELLQERRNALIFDAVSGRIDVRAYMAKPVMSATQYSSGFAHQLLAAEILDRCNSQRMGRIKLQKLIHLCEYHGQVSEVQGDYSRKAAGPFDARAMAGISKNLKKQKWFEEVKEGERYVYRPLEKRGEHKKYLAHWQTEMPRIDEVLSLLGNFRTRECEIISTLYAAWNDLLIDGGATDDAAILHEASSAERWHKSKEQIAPERWTKALQWMKDKGLVPVGYGKHTRHTAGQIGTITEEAHEPA